MGCPLSTSSKVLQISKKGPPNMTESEEYVEDVVCKSSDVQENEAKVFDLRDVGKVLVVRQKGKLSALGAKCTHYGAPLQSSAVGDGRLRCQWHGACFNIATGDIEDFPGLDSLPCYQVSVQDDNVTVRARRSELESNKRIKSMSKRDPNNNQHFVIIGGGPSGAVCAETLRQEGFQGKLTVVAKERYLPYDRIKLSKVMDVPIENLQLRASSFYATYDIDFILDCEATKIDLDHKQISLKDGRSLNYDRVYVATGSSPRKADIPGANLENVMVLRNYDQSSSIHALLGPEKHVVVLGSSFIAMEAAAYCVGKAASVTVISRSSVPFEPVFGKEVGGALLKLFLEKEVKFFGESGIKSCAGDANGVLTEVELLDGSKLKADVLIMGTGSALNTQFLRESGVPVNGDGSVTVSEYLQTSVPNIFAGGDIANAPIWSHGNEHGFIGHYGLAQYHGKIAAMNMLNKGQVLKAVPFFWTMLFGKSVRYCGYGRFDSVVVRGDVDNFVFVAYFVKNEEVVSICASGMDPIVSKYAEYVFQGNKLYKKDLGKDPFELLQ
ncbi:hypothetical protein PPYR_02801 [Photinus pyralis]|uniref:Rieske domain-containing protein n=2 Tax=Photinus pyralis TaxID=7054 RepID=A0A5N4A140_PHOPY|nr:hypothetical protein PPYR_02801 [Photinus pyralis]